MAFDIEGARTAGYSDTEIADYMGKDAGFDVVAAQQAGYSPNEIIGHLSSAKPVKATALESPSSNTQAMPVETGNPMGTGAEEIANAPKTAPQAGGGRGFVNPPNAVSETVAQRAGRMAANAGGSVMAGVHEMGTAAGIATLAPAKAIDFVHGLITGKEETGAQEYAGQAFIDPNVSAAEFWAPKEADQPGIADKVVNGLARMAPSLAAAIATGGAAAAPEVAVGMQAVKQAVTAGMKSMSVPAFSSGINKASELIREGAPIGTAIRAGLTEGMTSDITGGLAMSAPGAKIATRALQGAAVGATTGEVARQAQNIAAPEYATERTPEGLAISALTGAVLGGSMRHPTGPEIRGRAELGYEPTPAEIAKAPEAAPQPAPISDIARATNVDAAIEAANASIASPAAAREAAAELLAIRPLEAPNVRLPTEVRPVAPETTRGRGAEPGVGVETGLGTEPVAARVMEPERVPNQPNRATVPLEPQPNAIEAQRAETAQNEQNNAQRAEAKTEAPPAEAPKAGENAGIEQAPARAEARAGAVEAAGLAGERSPAALAAMKSLVDNANSPTEPPEWKSIKNGFSARQYVQEVEGKRLPIQEIQAPNGAVIRRGLDFNGKSYFELEGSGTLDQVMRGIPFSEFTSYFNKAGSSTRQIAINTKPANAMHAPQGAQVSFYPGKYGKGMGYDAARLEAQRLNRVNTDETITYAAEEHNNPKLENPWTVVGRRIIPEAQPARTELAQTVTQAISNETPNAAQQRAEFAAAEKARKVPGNAARTRANEANPFKAFLGKHGISNSLAGEFAPGRAERQAAMVQGYGPMFRKSGPQLGTLARRAVEEGYLLHPDEDKLHGMIVDALRGRRIIPQYAEGVAENEMQARIARHEEFSRQMPDDVLEDLDSGIPEFGEASNTSTEAAMRSLGFTEQEITDAIATESKGPSQISTGRGQANEASTSGAQNRVAERNAASRAEAEGLTAPTREQVLSQQERKANAEILDQRRQIEREAAGQKLEQQTVPEQRSDTSGDMFAREKAEAEIEKRNAGKPAEDNGTTPLFSRGGAIPALEPFKTKSGATAFKTPEVALADPKLNPRQPGGDVKRIDYEIRDRAEYAKAIREGATPAEARDQSHAGHVTLDVDANGTFKSLRNIEIFQSKRGGGIAEKVIGGIMHSLPENSRLNIHDILPKAVGFWDKMGAKFPRSEDFMEANLSPEQFRNAYDTRTRTAGTRGQPEESRTGENAGAGNGGLGNNARVAPGLPEKPQANIRNPSTIEQVRGAVTDLIGGKQLPNKLGRVVVATAADIKATWEPIIGHNLNLGSEGEAGAAQGFYDSGTKTVFLISDHIPKGDEQAVLAHELMHKHGQAVLGKEGWDKLHGTIDGWKNANEGSQERQVYDAASAKVEAVGAELSSQELFPYAVEEAIRMGIKPSLIAKQGTVARWLGSVKYAMQQAWGKITGKPETFKAQDLVDLAFGIAQMENPESAMAMAMVHVNEKAVEPTQAQSHEYDEAIAAGQKRKALRVLHDVLGVKDVDFTVDRGGAHAPSGPEDGSPLYDVSRNGTYPEDVYSANGLRYYGTGEDVMDREAYRLIQQYAEHPNKPITIYRAVYKSESNKLEPGAWITTVRQYAKDHGDSTLHGDYKIISKQVYARDIFTSGDSWLEWGYHPQAFKPELPKGDRKNISLAERVNPKEPAAPEIGGARHIQTNTPAFKKWFGESKVVDDQGNPEVVYHGTGKAFNKVNMKKGAQGLFWMTTDKAAIEAGEVGAQGRGAIMDLYARITKPAGWEEYDRMGIDELRRDGYDGIILPETDGTKTVVVFEPDQVKSASRNNGEFNPANADIRFSRANTAEGEAAQEEAKPYAGPGAQMINGARDFHRELMMRFAPMSAGEQKPQAVAQTFVNNVRVARHQWQQMSTLIKAKFSKDERKAMLEAAEEQNNLMQQGLPTAGKGIDALTPKQRAYMETLHIYADQLWARAKAVGLVEGEGLPFWTPRMAVEIGEEGEFSRLGGTRKQATSSGEGRNVFTTAPSAKHRKHETLTESEAALKAKMGEKAAYVRDILTMPLAMSRFEQAIAGRELINQIKEIGLATGKELVSPVGGPNFFTLDHPAFTKWRPRFTTDAEGKTVAVKDENGQTIMDRKPLFIDKSFEGPLKAVMSTTDGKIYSGYMLLKSKAMTAIMTSPLTHNMVIYGRALAYDPLKVGSGYLYWKGHIMAKDNELMNKLIGAGMVPIGANKNSMMDITDVARGLGKEGGWGDPNESWISLSLQKLGNALHQGTGDTIKEKTDALGDFVHHTLLWKQVGAVQVGIANDMLQHLMSKGFSEKAGLILAAHFSNRYAGAIASENMSEMARKAANMILFSRSFNMGNLGAMKDIFAGMSAGLKAKLMEEVGAVEGKRAIGYAKRKAIASILTEVGFAVIALSVVQSAVDYLKKDKSLSDIEQGYLRRLEGIIGEIKAHPFTPSSYNPYAVSPTWENEPGKQDRINMGELPGGRNEYMRLPTGKVVEDMIGWSTNFGETFSKKMSPMAKSIWQDISNDKGFDVPVADPTGNFWQKTYDMVSHVVKAQVPWDTMKTAYDATQGKATELEKNKLLGFATGFSFSQGHPGGPEAGVAAKTEERIKASKAYAMEQVKDLLKYGKEDEARSRLEQIGLPNSEINRIIRKIEEPKAGMNRAAQRRFNAHANEEEKTSMERVAQ